MIDQAGFLVILIPDHLGVVHAIFWKYLYNDNKCYSFLIHVSHFIPAKQTTHTYIFIIYMCILLSDNHFVFCHYSLVFPVL